MTKAKNEEEQIVISTDDARGGLSPEEVTASDTLLPMLIGGLALIILGIILILVII